MIKVVYSIKTSYVEGEDYLKNYYHRTRDMYWTARDGIHTGKLAII